MALIDIAYIREPSSGAVIFDGDGFPVYDDLANVNANTYLQLQQRIQNEVLGSPTTTDIQNAIGDAIAEYERETFDLNRVRYFGAQLGSGGNLRTIQGQEFYSNVDLPVLINYPHITNIVIVAFSNRYPLINRTPQWIDLQSVSTTWQGLPTDWAWDSGSVRLFPVPDASYPIVIDATIRFRPMVNDTDYSVWTNRAEAVIRIESKRLLFRNIIRDEAQVQAMELELLGNPQTGRQGALGMLRREATRRAGGPGHLRASRSYM